MAQRSKRTGRAAGSRGARQGRVPDRAPASNFERGAADADIEITRDSPENTDEFDRGRIGGGPGAGDGSSGGGAGAGIPGAGTDMRTGGRLQRGDVQEDRKKIFPQTAKARGKSGRIKASEQPPPKGL